MTYFLLLLKVINDVKALTNTPHIRTRTTRTTAEYEQTR